MQKQIDKVTIGKESRNKGYAMETIAANWLRLKGYKILNRNFVSGRGIGAGEIDIIATKGKNIIFIEVKFRKHIDEAAYSISTYSKKRIFRAAEFFLSLHSEYLDYGVRFDAILLGEKSYPIHIKDAWRKDWW